MTNVEGKKGSQIPFPGTRIETQSWQRAGGSGALETALLKLLTPSTTRWSHWEHEHEGNFSQWKDFFIASVLQTPPGLLIMNLGLLTSKCVT